jgi:alpha-amylase
MNTFLTDLQLPTSLPAGTYCDVVAGAKSGNGCSGAKATVAGGKITVKVPARTAMAFYIGMKL